MLNGKTQTGFDFKIEDEALDDYELLEALVDVDNGNEAKIILVIEKLLGKKQKEELKDHVRELHGRVSSKAMISEVTDIFKATQETKN